MMALLGMPKKTIDQIEVASKRVLMRVDFNVPLDAEGAITDDRRIRQSLPSIQSVTGRKGRLVLMSHLGRPEGAPEAGLSLEPAAKRLAELVSPASVRFVGGDCVSRAAADAVASMGDGEIVVLENLRFNPGETVGDAQFAGKLAAFGDVYCNDAFGSAHRGHASMVAVPEAMDARPKVAGLLLARELQFLSEAIAKPKRPFVAVLGGAKISDKLGALSNLMGKVETILVGGAMAYTLLKALGHEVGTSLVQLGMLKKAEQVIDEAAASPTDLIVPSDHVCGKQITRLTPVKVAASSIPAGWMGLDIGPETSARYVKSLHDARTIVWNGPMGVFETPPFDVGTRQVAEGIVKATQDGAVSVVGGGETAAAVEGFGLSEGFSHVSTGGGASLQMLEGRSFDSVAALDEA